MSSPDERHAPQEAHQLRTGGLAAAEKPLAGHELAAMSSPMSTTGGAPPTTTRREPPGSPLHGGGTAHRPRTPDPPPIPIHGAPASRAGGKASPPDRPHHRHPPRTAVRLLRTRTRRLPRTTPVPRGAGVVSGACRGGLLSTGKMRKSPTQWGYGRCVRYPA